MSENINEQIECCDCNEIHEDLLKIVNDTMPEETELYDLAELFKVFGDSTRIRILFVLFEAEVCVCDLAKVLNHSMEKVGADDYIRFTTTHFSTFAIVDKAEAEKLIAAQNADHIKALMQNAQCKVTTSKTSKKSVKIQVAAKNDKTLLTDIKNMGYTVKYQFYRSTKKDAGYKLRKTSSKNSFISTKGTKGRKYYYKARVLVYDGKKLVAKSALKQCSYGARTWTK